MVLDSDDEDLTLGELMEDAYLEEDDEEETDDNEPTLTFKVEHGRIRRKTDELDAMVQAVDKILQTERYVYQIYDEDYGNDLPELIGKNIDYAETEIPRMITEALTADDRIIEVNISSIDKTDRNTLTVKGSCETIYGSVPIESEVTIGNESR